MGQAFDESGRVLGEAAGATKSEVFEKLIEEFPQAHEIRIKSLKDRLDAEDARVREVASPQAELPRYRCHKEVWALKIGAIHMDHPACVLPGDAMLTPTDTRYAPFLVRREYIEKHSPHAGGYYVVYKDGYKSFSPADAFEDGYTRISS
jgi:hypothetical protein